MRDSSSPPTTSSKMANVPDPASLTPRFCLNQTALRDFLRMSRSTIDDTIAQQLNALVTPGTTSPFDPRSTSSMAPRARRPLAREACAGFTRQVLFPSWQSRSDVLNYCAGVATSPDPEDPEQVLRQEQDARARERIVDERLDPYSARYFPPDTRTEALAALVRNERAVERIVRARTWRVLGERCQDAAPEYERELEEWRCRR
nr:mitochondrial intermembrane space cysteine motif-containing protein mix23 [Quercus suber]